MPQITSEVGVCNLAQIHLKGNPIASLINPKSKAEITYAAIFDVCRRMTLEAHPWNFASKRTTVGQSADTPTHGWAYQSALLPDDFIRVNTIGQNDDWTSDSYALEGNRILADSQAPYYLQYVYNFTDIQRMSPKFIYALSLCLAAAGAYQITGNGALADSLQAKFDALFQEAQSTDGQQRPPVRRQVSKWNRARSRLCRSSTDALYLGGE